MTDQNFYEAVSCLDDTFMAHAGQQVSAIADHRDEQATIEAYALLLGFSI